MKMNVIMKSTLRQRGRTLLLVVLMGVAAFALVARVTEFVVVRGELARILDFYRAVGILSPLRSDNFTTDHDVTRALDIVEGNRHVAVSDTRRFTQGVMDGLLNTVTHPQENFFNPRMNSVDIAITDFYILGYTTIVPRITADVYNPSYILQLSVEALLTGDPDVIRTYDMIFTNERGQTTSILSRYTVRLFMSAEDGARVRRGEWSPLAGLELEELTLFRVTPVFVVRPDGIDGVEWHMQPVDEANGLFFVSASDEAVLASTLDNLYDEFALIRENSSAVLVMDSHDMTVMPRFMDPRIAWLQQQGPPFAEGLPPRGFYGGRFLTYEDYGQPVVAISLQLATRRGLRVGDTLTLTMRDNPRPTWIDSPTDSPWARGVENWWDNNPQGWWGMIDTAHEDWRGFPTHTMELEVVGIYWFVPTVFTNFTMAEVFVPAGVIPAGFGWEDAPQLTGMYSFVLDSPRSIDNFTHRTRDALAEAGFTVSFIPTGFDSLAEAADPIHFSITVNLVVFGAAALIIFFFVIFLYIRHWRKSIAVARALGIPANTVLRQLFSPVAALWLPAVAAGSVGAWFFALAQAQETLAGLAAYDAQAALPLYWLIVFTAVIGAAICLSVGAAGYRAAHKPILIQLQGDTSRQQKHIHAGDVPVNFAVGTITLKPLVPQARTARRNAVRHCIRNITRMPVKTALAAVLSLVLVFSLGWLYNLILFTEGEVQRLWDTTVVEAELLEEFTGERVVQRAYVIDPDVWDRIANSGFLGAAYLEAVASDDRNIFMGVSHLPGFVAENTKTVSDEQIGVICDDMEITFLPGFGEVDFAYESGRPIPVVIRRGLDETQGIPLDVPFTLPDEGEARVIGFFDGGLLRAVNRFGEGSALLVIPIEAHRARFSGVWPFYGMNSFGTYRPPYMTARFTIDPARNREIDDFRYLVEPFLPENRLGLMGGDIPLRIIINDEVLHGAVLPMERNLELLRILYPIAIALTFVLAIGLSLLSMLPNAKNAAIMRALGKTRADTQLSLCIGQTAVFLLGALMGLAVLFVIGAGGTAVPFMQALMYVGGGTLGAVVGAVIITAKKPMELLQIRE